MPVEPVKTDVVVIGAGPGGYAAAFYAADKGKRVVLVEQDARLGGVCLNRGCIPSKALLHATELMREAKEASPRRGITFGTPKVELTKLRAWKDSVLDKLSQGIRTLSQHRGVEVWHGRGYFEDSRTLRVETADGQKFLTYATAIIAVGSKPALPSAFDLEHAWPNLHYLIVSVRAGRAGDARSWRLRGDRSQFHEETLCPSPF